MIERAAFTQKTVDKFRGLDFEWGKTDCLKMARWHLIKAGHKVPQIPNYKTGKAALRRLKEQGVDSVSDLLEMYCLKIPYAMCRVGDIVTAAGDEGMEAVLIYCGNNKYLGFSEVTGKAEIMTLQEIKAGFCV